MSKLSIVNEGSGNFIVDGDLTFSAMDKKTVSSFAFLSTSKQISVDLGGVGNADSAGLALMIEWVKYSRSKRVQLRFRNIPKQLLNLAKLSGLDKTSYFISAKSGLAVTE
ncbi:MAG: STAS domain-containing protein [Proteobacteria bacterium]|nr:STAS domain-containing protein [Pseudomonadota bacterium]